MQTIIALVLLPTIVVGQTNRLDFIKQQVASIDTDRSLTVDTVDLAVATGVWLDGGGAITYHYHGNRLVKIEEEYFPSYGRILTQYYFHEDTLMLVRDLEDNHPWLPDSSGVDPTRLVRQFEAAYYMWTVDEDVAREQTGVRVLSEGPCGNLEWEPTVQRLLDMAPRAKPARK